MASSIWQRARDAESSVQLVAALFAMVLAGLGIPGSVDFPLDDAWIHLAYAKSLRLGEGLSYNPGDWETGVSSPLWVLLLAVWPSGANPVPAVKLLGMLLHGATAWLGASIAIALGRSQATDAAPIPVRSLALLSGTLVASTPSLLQGATSGMEVPLSSTLVLATILTMILGLSWQSAVLGFLAVLARPEALMFVGTMGALLATARRLTDTDGWRAGAWAAAGSFLALGAWSAYCLAVSGYPWPNTQYVKGVGGGLDGLAYLGHEVLPWQPWLVSLTGVALLVFAVRRDLQLRRYELTTMLVATVTTYVAIAITRPLHVGVLFYESRYFTIFAAVPAIVVVFGVLGRRRWVGLALVAPIAIVTGLQARSLHLVQRTQEQDTYAVHTTPARLVATTLDANAIVAVEGAGAERFFTPRTMTIIDLVGLNDRQAAHLHFDRQAKLCHFVGRDPTHMVMPLDWYPLFRSTFELTQLETFDDPVYTQTNPPRPLRVVLYEVRGITDAARAACLGA